MQYEYHMMLSERHKEQGMIHADILAQLGGTDNRRGIRDVDPSTEERVPPVEVDSTNDWKTGSADSQSAHGPVTEVPTMSSTTVATTQDTTTSTTQRPPNATGCEDFICLLAKFDLIKTNKGYILEKTAKSVPGSECSTFHCWLNQFSVKNLSYGLELVRHGTEDKGPNFEMLKAGDVFQYGSPKDSGNPATYNDSADQGSNWSGNPAANTRGNPAIESSSDTDYGTSGNHLTDTTGNPDTTTSGNPGTDLSGNPGTGTSFTPDTGTSGNLARDTTGNPKAYSKYQLEYENSGKPVENTKIDYNDEESYSLLSPDSSSHEIGKNQKMSANYFYEDYDYSGDLNGHDDHNDIHDIDTGSQNDKYYDTQNGFQSGNTFHYDAIFPEYDYEY